MKKNLLLCLCLLLIGCVPYVKIVRATSYGSLLPATVQISFNERLAYFPEPWKQNLREVVYNGILRQLKKYSIPVVEDNADIILSIDNINTGGWSAHPVVTFVQVRALKGETALFKVSFEQNPTVVGEVYKFWMIFKNPEQIANLCGKRIVKELFRKREI